MNKLPIAERVRILRMLLEGNSLRATASMANVSRNTVDKLLCDVGAACLAYQDEILKSLPCKHIKCDQIWSFACSKQKNVLEGLEEAAGDVWTWSAIDIDTKLVLCWHVSNRTFEYAEHFIDDLVSRLANRMHLTTDSHRFYLESIEGAFGGDIDYAELIKLYVANDKKNSEKRNSPTNYLDSKKNKVTRNSGENFVSNNYVECQSLVMCMSARQFARSTTGIVRKIENHMHAISLHYMYYNFGKVHESIRVTPAIEVGIADHVWSLEEIAALVPNERTKECDSYKRKC